MKLWIMEGYLVRFLLRLNNILYILYIYSIIEDRANHLLLCVHNP